MKIGVFSPSCFILSVLTTTHNKHMEVETNEKEKGKKDKKKEKKKGLKVGDHLWKTTTFHSPTNCQLCDSLLWGLVKQGVVCSGFCLLLLFKRMASSPFLFFNSLITLECHFIAHEKCVGDVPPCGTAVPKSKAKSLKKEKEERGGDGAGQGKRGVDQGGRKTGEHLWKVTTFHSPTNCQYCDSLLWGLTKQGVVCAGESLFLSFLLSVYSSFFFLTFPFPDCSYISHEKCVPNILNCCSYEAEDKKVFGLRASESEDSEEPQEFSSPKKGEAIYKTDPHLPPGREHEWFEEKRASSLILDFFFFFFFNFNFFFSYPRC